MALLPLCRVPSEALPITSGKGSGPNAHYTEGQELKLELQRRKNRVESTTLIRRCWCSQSVVASYHAPVACQRRLVYVSQETCPVHVVGNAIAQCEAGSTLFQGITPGITVAKIREVLASLGYHRLKSLAPTISDVAMPKTCRCQVRRFTRSWQQDNGNLQRSLLI